MEKYNSVDIILYTDSTGCPRKGSCSISETWPFLLVEEIRRHTKIKASIINRAFGGATIKELFNIFRRDLGYIGKDQKSKLIVITCIGLVDSSPQPFTYCLRYLQKIPLIGPRIWAGIEPTLRAKRPLLQNLWSFRRTPKKAFLKVFRNFQRLGKKMGVKILNIETPLTPIFLEKRSPNLRASISEYNAIKRKNSENSLRTKFFRSCHYMEDGQHFSQRGHKIMAKKVSEFLIKKKFV